MAAASVSGSTYRERRPPQPVASFIECFWRRERWRPPAFKLGVLPDGRLDLIWAENGDVVVIGPQSRPLGRPLPLEAVVVGIRFPPGVGPWILGVPAHEIADMHISLDAIDSRPAVSLLRQLAVIENADAAPGEIARAIVN